MKDIPLVSEAEALRAKYREAYGDSSYEYQEDMLEHMEFRLLNDEYAKKFDDCVGTMCMTRDLSEVNEELRECLRSGKPYEDGVPEGALI